MSYLSHEKRGRSAMLWRQQPRPRWSSASGCCS